MVVRKNIDIKKPPTEEQREMLEKARSLPAVPDDDCPEYSPEEIKRLRKLAEKKRAERQKQTVTLRISPQALSKARSLGKGYTSVLSRILESALSDNETIKRFL